MTNEDREQSTFFTNAEIVNRIVGKLDKLDDRLDSVDKTLVKQELNLQEHMRRSDLLEEQMQPLKRHVAIFEAFLKVFGATSAVLATIGSILKILHYL